MSTKTATVRHTGFGLRLAVRTGTGHTLTLDDATGDAGPRPSEMLVAALGGCAALDVLPILAKKRQEVTGYEVRVTAQQRDDPYPHVMTRIDVLHVVEGPEIEVEAVRRAIELSATRYCTATAMLASGVAEIHHRYLVRRGVGEAVEELEGEVLVTGPHADPDATAAEPAATAVTAAARPIPRSA